MSIKKQLIVLTLLAFISDISNAQTGGDFAIEKSVIASGGGQSGGGDFQLSGTVGQATASNASTGGDFNLTGGFWQSKNNDIIFKNGFE